MVQEVSSGIKVQVQPLFEGRYITQQGPFYLFKYNIELENLSAYSMQLISRYWQIYDLCNEPSEVEGMGVVGLQPTLEPGEVFRYSSSCYLKNGLGYMKGHYNFKRLMDSSALEVAIPKFQLFATPLLN